MDSKNLVMTLGEVPFVHPGNLNAIQLLHYLRKLSSDLEKVVDLQNAEFMAKRAAPLAQERFENAKAKFLEAVGPLFRVATLFPESQEEVSFDTYPEGCSSPVPAQLPR